MVRDQPVDDFQVRPRRRRWRPAWPTLAGKNVKLPNADHRKIAESARISREVGCDDSDDEGSLPEECVDELVEDFRDGPWQRS